MGEGVTRQDQGNYPRRADFGARILVVEDDAVTRRLIRAVLERSYYTVAMVTNGLEGLQALATCQPDLVLLDIRMPGIDGIETCRRMRDAPGGDVLPIIFLTSDTRDEVHAEAFRAKGDDFLRKPVLPAELIVTARTEGDDVVMGIRHTSAPLEGVQFHPESVLTPVGPHILANFLRLSGEGEAALLDEVAGSFALAGMEEVR